MAARPRMDISADPEALAHRVAQWITDLACHAGGRFAVALSGGVIDRIGAREASPIRDVPLDRRAHLAARPI